jgi:hypothetical protein
MRPTQLALVAVFLVQCSTVQAHGIMHLCAHAGRILLWRVAMSVLMCAGCCVGGTTAQLLAANRSCLVHAANRRLGQKVAPM